MDESTQTQQNRLYDEYVELRAQQQKLIADLLVELPKVDNLDEAYIHQARDAQFHTETPFLMAFVGPFSSGKSSVINALLGAEVLRVGPTPTTDRITILRYGEEPQQMTSGDETVTLFHPSALLQKVSFVDTPGLESVFQEHEETTRGFLHRSDLVFLVMLATQAMTARNVEYLKTLEQYGKKVIILVNQADLLTVEERQTVKEYVLSQSREHLGTTPEVW
ncbi:MAG: Dynamin family protein, partial [Chloroflexi bacterium]